MKNLKLFLFLFVLSGLGLTACNNDNAAKDEARESLATTAEVEASTPDKTANEGPVINVPSGPTTSIDFMGNEVFDYGTITDGEVVNHTFKFKNTGSEPLVISNAKGSCGCTVPQWPREPIAPGATGEIQVKFDSKGKGKEGGSAQSKKVTITANTEPANTYLTVKGTIEK